MLNTRLSHTDHNYCESNRRNRREGRGRVCVATLRGKGWVPASVPPMLTVFSMQISTLISLFSVDAPNSSPSPPIPLHLSLREGLKTTSRPRNRLPWPRANSSWGWRRGWSRAATREAALSAIRVRLRCSWILRGKCTRRRTESGRWWRTRLIRTWFGSRERKTLRRSGRGSGEWSPPLASASLLLDFSSRTISVLLNFSFKMVT